MKTQRRHHLLVILPVVLAGCGGDVAREPQAATRSATLAPTQRVIPAGTAAIEPGTYRVPRSAWSVTDFTITFPEGWTVQYGHTYLKHSDAPGEVGFYAVVVDAIYADACGGDGERIKIGPSVDDFVAALLQQDGPITSDPVNTTLGGYPATRIDMTVPKEFDLKACRLGEIGLQVWYSPPADKYFVLLPDGNASVYVLDVKGQRQVFLTQYRSPASDNDVRELQTILDSIEIEA